MKSWTIALSLFVLVLAVSAVSALADRIDHRHDGIAQRKGSVEAPLRCEVCGMDRSVFNYSRVVVEYQDGGSVGTCSLNCAYEEVSGHPAKKMQGIRTADYATRKLIDAKTAVWVVGGRKHGVMSPVAKWAFAKRSDAENYVGDFGGAVVGFDEAWKAAAGSSIDSEGTK